MRLYWMRESIPELRGLPRKAQRRAWRHAYVRTLFRPVPLSVLLLDAVGVAALDEELSVRTGWLFFVVLVSAGILAFGHGQLVIHFARPRLREYLTREGSTS